MPYKIVFGENTNGVMKLCLVEVSTPTEQGSDSKSRGSDELHKDE